VPGTIGWRPAAAVLTVALVVAALGAVVPSSPASAYPASTVTLEGHGYGHGHGMGQWGALGDALAGTGYRPILSHFYGGTALAGLSAAQEATQVRVALTENDGNTVIVTSDSAFTVPGAGLQVGAGRAAVARGRPRRRPPTSPIPPPYRARTRASAPLPPPPRPSSCARAGAT
jgi:hypothetical protein